MNPEPSLLASISRRLADGWGVHGSGAAQQVLAFLGT
jgi:hypothetical protein